MSNNISDFKNKLKGKGARPNLFRVRVNFPGYTGGDNETASFLIKSAALPGVEIGEIPIPYRGRKLYVPGDTEFEPWEVTVINDTDFALRDAFLAWKNGYNDNVTNRSTQGPDNWTTDIQVDQLGRDEQVIKTYTLFDAWVRVVGQIELSFDNENTIEEFPVTFRYLHWD